MINSKHKFENVSVATDEEISSERGWKYRKYKKLTANMIPTRPLQSPTYDFGFVVT